MSSRGFRLRLSGLLGIPRRLLSLKEVMSIGRGAIEAPRRLKASKAGEDDV